MESSWVLSEGPVDKQHKSCLIKTITWRASRLSSAPETLSVTFFLSCLIFYPNFFIVKLNTRLFWLNFTSGVNIYIFFLRELASDGINFSGEGDVLKKLL